MLHNIGRMVSDRYKPFGLGIRIKPFENINHRIIDRLVAFARYDLDIFSVQKQAFNAIMETKSHESC